MFEFLKKLFGVKPAPTATEVAPVVVPQPVEASPAPVTPVPSKVEEKLLPVETPAPVEAQTAVELVSAPAPVVEAPVASVPAAMTATKPKRARKSEPATEAASDNTIAMPKKRVRKNSAEAGVDTVAWPFERPLEGADKTAAAAPKTTRKSTSKKTQK